MKRPRDNTSINRKKEKRVNLYNLLSSGARVIVNKDIYRVPNNQSIPHGPYVMRHSPYGSWLIERTDLKPHALYASQGEQGVIIGDAMPSWFGCLDKGKPQPRYIQVRMQDDTIKTFRATSLNIVP